MSKVSIIVPVYNAEKYIKPCFDTLLNQTLKDIEIICVDDCSTDNSLELLKGYASKDNRIKIIEQKVNQGQGVARNEALKCATGEYIGFVDPDDWIEPNMYEEMYNKAKEFDTDIVTCNIERFFENSSQVDHIDTIKKISKIDKTIKSGVVFNFKKTEKKFLANTTNYPVCRIYRRELVTKYDIRFAPIRTGEDKLFCCLAKLLADKIIHIDKEFYHYRTHRAKQFIKNEHQDIMCLSLINEIYMHNPSKELKEGIIDFLSIMCINQYKQLTPAERKDFYRECANYLPHNSFKKFRKNVAKFNCKQILRHIFSIKKVVENGARHKYICVLGFKFELKNYIKD